MIIYGGLYQRFNEKFDINFDNFEEEVYYNDVVSFDLENTNDIFKEFKNSLIHNRFSDVIIFCFQ